MAFSCCDVFVPYFSFRPTPVAGATPSWSHCCRCRSNLIFSLAPTHPSAGAVHRGPGNATPHSIGRRNHLDAKAFFHGQANNTKGPPSVAITHLFIVDAVTTEKQ